MTINEARKLIVNWFRKNDYFDKTDFKKLILVTETPDEDYRAVSIALDMLTAEKFVGCYGNTFVLNDRIKTVVQNVSIESETAQGMADTIKNFSDATDEIAECDPHDITETDIVSLLMIIEMLLNQVSQLSKDADRESE